MKKLLTILISVAMLFGCSQDDKYDDLENRLDALEKQYQEMNANISSMQKVVTALQQNLTISRVQKIEDGYIIHFSDGSTATIKNGKDNENVSTAIVSVKKDVDGIYYWMLNNQWLRDGAGRKINAQEEGGVIPELKIQNERWVISVDGGYTWTYIGNATGGNVSNCVFKSVTEDDENVYFTLEDNSVITIPKGDSTKFGINFDTADIAMPDAGGTETISYTITGATDKTIVKTVCQDGWKAKVTATSTSAGTITITAPTPFVNSEILVFANDGSYRTAMAAIDCQTGFITVADDTYDVPAAGGNLEVKLTTNINYTVEMPEYTSWVSLTGTRAVRDEVLTFSIKPNTGFSRSAIVKLLYNNEVIQTIGFSQAGDYSEEKGVILATESDIVNLQKDKTEIIDGSLAIAGSTITTLSLLNNQIKEITGDLIIDCSSLTSLEGLSGLTKIGGNLIVIQGGFVNFEGLNNLKEIVGDFQFEPINTSSVTSLPVLNSLKNFDGLNNLTKIGGDFEIVSLDYRFLAPALNSLESFEGLNNLQEIAGSFIIESEGTLNSLKSFKGLTGLTKIGGNFSISSSDNYTYTATEPIVVPSMNLLESFEGLDNLKEIKGNFKIKGIGTSLSALKTFNGLSGLIKIGGYFDINTRNDALSLLESFEGLTNLKEIGGRFRIIVHSTKEGTFLSSLKAFNGLSGLTKIGGDFDISFTGGYPALAALESLEGLTNLQEIAGNIQITAFGALASLNGLSGLRTVGSGNITISHCHKLSDISSLSGITSVINDITISDCAVLYDFSALKPLVQTMTGTWSVTGCNFNPTKDQILNGVGLP